jgi:hypothetical protein
MDKRIIPTKNYFIFAAIAILSFVIVFNLAKIYKDIKNEKNTSEINLTIFEVLESEIDEFLTENDSKIIYFAYSQNKDILDFEEDLKKYVVKNQIENNFVYLDLSKTSLNFQTSFSKSYLKNDFKDIKLEYPNMIYFKDGVAASALYFLETEINIEDVKLFIEQIEELND